MTTRSTALGNQPVSPKRSENQTEVLSKDVEILPAVEDNVEVVELPGEAEGEDRRARAGGVHDGVAEPDHAGGPEAAAEDLDAQPSAPRRVLPDPGQPTARQVAEHRIDHWPLRPWCKFCMQGRCTSEHHSGVPDERKTPKLCFDYLFCTKNKRMALKRDLLENEEVEMKVLVAKEAVSKAIFAHAVDVKGADNEGYAVGRLVDDVKWLGYTKLALKTDNEPAIVKVLKDTLITARVEIPELQQATEEHGARYDSASMGEVESAVKQVQRMLRTLKLCLEDRLKRRIPTNHPVMTWLVEHTAWILRNRVVGADGRTAHQRVRGRECGRREIGFGEKVLYMLPRKGPDHDARAKLAALCEEGIVLGYSKNSPEYHIYD